MKMPKVVYRDLASGRLLTMQEAIVREPCTWAVEKFIAPDKSEHHSHRKDLPSVKHLDLLSPRSHVDDESIAALGVEKRLLDEILQVTKEGDLTKADQERLDDFSAKRDKLHATQAWQRAVADKANQ